MRSRATRRTLPLVVAVAGSVALVLALWALWLEPSSLRIDEQHLDVPWPAQRALRVAVLTDLHIGSPFNGLGKLRETVARTNAARADLVCILGKAYRVRGVSLADDDGRMNITNAECGKLRMLNA